MQQVRLRKMAKFALVGGLILLAVYLVRVVLLPIAVAAVLCYLVLPVTAFWERQGLKKGWAAAAALAVFFMLAVAVLWWLVPRIYHDFAYLGQLASVAGVVLDKVNNDWRGFRLGGDQSTLASACLAGLSERVGDVISRLLEKSIGWLPGFIGNVSLLVFTPIFAFYLLRDRDKLLELIPREVRPLVVDINHILQAFVRGYLLVALAVGVLFGALVWLFGLRYGYTLGAIMLLAELVPYLGPFLAFFPCVALGLVQGRAALIKLLLIWLFVQQAENLLISPHIMSGVMRLSPFYIMLAVLIGGFWWGVFGMILAVPLAAVLKALANATMEWWQREGEPTPEVWIK